MGCGAGASCQRGALPPEEGCRCRSSPQPRGGVGVAPTKISHGCALSQNKVSSEFNEGALVESTVRGVWARRASPLGPGLPPPGPVLWQRWAGGLPSDRWHGDRAANGLVTARRWQPPAQGFYPKTHIANHVWCGCAELICVLLHQSKVYGFRRTWQFV